MGIYRRRDPPQKKSRAKKKKAGKNKIDPKRLKRLNKVAEVVGRKAEEERQRLKALERPHLHIDVMDVPGLVLQGGAFGSSRRRH